MGRPEQCASLIKEGKTPSDIARYLSTTYSTVVDYLFRAVGHNLIGLSDIVLSWPQKSRKLIEKIIKERSTEYWYAIYQEMKACDYEFTRDDVRLYLQLRNVYIGDLYFMICELELWLHASIKNVLQKEFNQSEEDWWTLGVPEKVKKKCNETMTINNKEKEHPYSYATFIQLALIIKSNWIRFKKYLPIDIIEGDDSLLANLDRINRIRNNIMHPLKSGLVQEDDDFKIVRGLYLKLITRDIIKN